MHGSRSWTRPRKRSRRTLILSVVLLTGCAIRPVSGLPFPEKPALHGAWVGESFCFPREDANALTIWFKKLVAFRRTYEGH